MENIDGQPSRRDLLMYHFYCRMKVCLYWTDFHTCAMAKVSAPPDCYLEPRCSGLRDLDKCRLNLNQQEPTRVEPRTLDRGVINEMGEKPDAI